MAFDFWQKLRSLTMARVGIGRSGPSLKTKNWLEFLRAHSEARHAVHAELDWSKFSESLIACGFRTQILLSGAKDKTSFLRRPDWGRRLSEDSRQKVLASIAAEGRDAFSQRLCFVVSDGLSAQAIEKYALELLLNFKKMNQQVDLKHRFELTDIYLVKLGRVGVIDEIGSLVGCKQIVILLGERPGLSCFDSLGVYFEHSPRLGNSDANRNCISNIHSDGLTTERAASKLFYLLSKSRRLGLSGVELKDDLAIEGEANFLLR